MRNRLSLATVLALVVSPLIAQLGPGTVNLRVLDCNGGPVTSCKVSVVRHFSGPERILVRIPSLANLELRPRDFLVDVASIQDLPRGEFVIQVAADMHAPTLSEPFTITQEANTADITVDLTRGATITGTVWGADGTPLAGAVVTTREPLKETPPWSNWPIDAPVTITLAESATDQDGHFRLANLAKGQYRIVMAHSAHCSETRTVTVTDQRCMSLPDTSLLRGTVLSGTCLLDDKRGAGLTVFVVKQDRRLPPELLSAWAATTDAQGRWQIEEQLPPGKYVVNASLTNITNDNMFEVMAQRKASEQTLTISAKQTKVEKALVIPKK